MAAPTTPTTDVPAAGRPGLPAGLLVLLGALSAFGPLSMDLYLPALPALQRDLGAGQAAAQLTVTLAAIGLAAGQLLAGPLSDRFGRRDPLLVGVGGWAGTSLLCALSPDVRVLCVLRLLQAVAPNATAVAMAGAAAVAGTASALLGVVQFAVGALVAPLGGLGGDGALLPVAAVIEGSAAAALLAAALPAARRGRATAAATAEGHPA